MSWTIPSTVELRALLADLEPGPSALVTVGAVLLLMLLVGLVVLLRGRRRRRVAARCEAARREAPRRKAEAASGPHTHRVPTVRRPTRAPLFARRDEPTDMLTSTLGQATDALEVLGALEAVDRDEPAEPGPPLPRWLAVESEVVATVVIESEVGEAVVLDPVVLDSVVLDSVVAEPVPVAPLAFPVTLTPPASVRGVAPGHARRPHADRAGVPPWMVVAGLAAVLLLRRRREPPRGA